MACKLASLQAVACQQNVTQMCAGQIFQESQDNGVPLSEEADVSPRPLVFAWPFEALAWALPFVKATMEAGSLVTSALLALFVTALEPEACP